MTPAKEVRVESDEWRIKHDELNAKMSLKIKELNKIISQKEERLIQAEIDKGSVVHTVTKTKKKRDRSSSSSSSSSGKSKKGVFKHEGDFQVKVLRDEWKKEMAQ